MSEYTTTFNKTQHFTKHIFLETHEIKQNTQFPHTQRHFTKHNNIQQNTITYRKIHFWIPNILLNTSFYKHTFLETHKMLQNTQFPNTQRHSTKNRILQNTQFLNIQHFIKHNISTNKMIYKTWPWTLRATVVKQQCISWIRQSHRMLRMKVMCVTLDWEDSIFPSRWEKKDIFKQASASK